jgi:very-short-patch-repair endonuclease
LREIKKENVDYINDSIKVAIICVTHGNFNQTPNKHLSGQGCPKCKILKTKQSKLKKYSKLFSIKSNIIHNNFYDYSMVDYIDCETSVKIICPKHGIFKQLPYNHLSGRGCLKCNFSKGERKIEKYLIDNNIKFEVQKKFNDCLNIQPLLFDFWIESKKILIEFDGIQHFKPLGFQGGDKKLEYTIKCDNIKDKYCKDKNINLLRISYKEINNIAKILSSIL